MKKALNIKVLMLILAAICIILVMTIFVGFSSSPQRKIREQLNLAARYMEELNYEQAVASYKAVIDIDPKNVDAYLGIADAYVGQGMKEEALEILDKGYEETKDERINDKIEEISAMKNDVSVFQQPENGAAETETMIDEKSPEEEDLQDSIELGNQYLENLEYEEALDVFKKSLEDDDKKADAYLGIVEVYIRQGDYDKALEYAEKGFMETGDDRLKEKIDMLNSDSIADSHGNILKESFYRGDELIYWNEYTYNEDGKKKDITVYDAEGNKIDYGQYEYDDKGLLLNDFAIRDDGFLSRIEIERDELGRITKQVDYDDHLGVGHSTYHEYFYKGTEELYYKYTTEERKDGQRLRISHGGSDIMAEWTYTLVYWDENERIQKAETYTESDIPFYSFEYENNNEGNIVRSDKYIYNSDGSVSDHTYWCYIYDEAGNKLTGKRYSDEGELLSEVDYSK